METVFSTQGSHPRDRLSLWYDVARTIYVQHHAQLDHGQAFSASITASSLANISASILQCDPIRFIRTTRHVEADSDGQLFIGRQQFGRCLWRQEGREAITATGDLAIMNAQKPYEISYLDPGAVLFLKVPLRDFEQRVGPIAGLTAITVSGSSELGGLASGFLDLLPSRLPIADEPAAARIADHALDLFAMALLATTTQNRPKLSSPREVALASLKAAIDNNLSESHLSSTDIATAAGISVRYASLLLAEHGTSISRYILDRRLEQCRRLLADPSQSHRSITEIALSWGFSDPSHFGRRFKQAYGVSPSDYRAATPKPHAAVTGLGLLRSG